MALAFIDKAVLSLASKVGLPLDLLRIAICLSLSYPLCAVLKRFPDNSRSAKSAFIIAVAMFYLLGIFSLWGGTRTLLISTVFTWIITSKFPGRPWMPWVNFLFVLSHLFVNHIAEQLNSALYADSFGVTGPQMVLCMKLTSFAWNVYDGTLLSKSSQQQKSKSSPALSSFQLERAILNPPSLLDFLSYAFFFPSLLTGPSFDYAEYIRWLDLTMFDTPDKNSNSKRHKRTIPKSHGPATVKLLQGICWFVLWTYITAYVNLEKYGDGGDFKFHERAVYLYLLGFTYRLKYYGAWSISEGACILSGIGYNGVDAKTGNLKWNRVRNIDPWAFETGQNTHQLLSAWNQNTNKWLKNYVYLRVTPKGRKPGFMSTLVTFITSAVWHGTWPGYYLTFIGGAFFQSLGRVFRKNLRPIFMQADGLSPGPYKYYYDALGFVVTQLAFGYMVQPFILLELQPSLHMWSTVYYYVHIGIITSIMLFNGPCGPAVKRFCRKWHPKLPESKNTVHSEVLRIKQLREDLGRLSSTPLLGIPEPDMDHMDSDIRQAALELDELKRELLTDLEVLRSSISGERSPFN